MREIVILNETNANGNIIRYGIEKEWLAHYAAQDTNDEGKPMSLEEFMENYTSDESNAAYLAALLVGKVAFVEDSEEDAPLSICGENEPWKNIAMVDHISQMMQDAGYTNASKYLDAAFDI